MRWRFEDLIAYTRTYEAGSLTAAAIQLQLSKSVLSKRIRGLEAALGAELFQRTTREMRPTELGAAFYERVAPLITELNEAAESVATKQSTTLHGLIRITAPMSFGVMFLGEPITAFFNQHKELDLSLDYDDRMLDLINSGYDVGIRIGNMVASPLRARRLCEIPRALYCSPDYARTYGLPRELGDLAHHDCINYANVRASKFWTFIQDGAPVSVEVRSRIVCNNGDAIKDLAMGGIGIASLPIFVAADSLRRGELIRAMPEARQPPYTLSAVYPPTRHVSQKVRSFIDHLISWFSAKPLWERD